MNIKEKFTENYEGILKVIEKENIYDEFIMYFKHITNLNENKFNTFQLYNIQRLHIFLKEHGTDFFKHFNNLPKNKIYDELDSIIFYGKVIESNKLNYYLSLFNMNYEELCQHLICKYGKAKNNFFSAKSYRDFMDGKIKSISKGTYSRTKDGLYCHHILENKYINMSSKYTIKQLKIPFEGQKKENLLYCDLVEHSILHTLIAKETNLEYGFPGLVYYLVPIIKDWYESKIIPKAQWMKNCQKRSFISESEAEILFDKIKKTLNKEIDANILLEDYIKNSFEDN